MTYLVIKTISPIFILIFVGFFCKYIGFINKKFVDELNRFGYYVALPCLLAAKIAESKVNISEQILPVCVAVMVTIIIVIMTFVPLKSIGWSKKEIAVAVHGAFRSNLAFIGLPVVFYSVGSSGLPMSIIIISVLVPIYNVLGVSLLLLDEESEQTWLELMKKNFKSFLINPLIWSCLLGLLLKPLEISPDNPLYVSAESLGKSAFPLALICLGFQLTIKIPLARLKKILYPVFNKLILSPLLGVFILYLMGSNQKEAYVCLSILLGCPTAVVSFVLAVEMKANAEFAADLVVMTTLLGIFTISLMLIILGSFGFWMPLN